MELFGNCFLLAFFPVSFLPSSLSCLLSAETEWRKKQQRNEDEEEDGELDDELWGLRVLQKQELTKVEQESSGLIHHRTSDPSVSVEDQTH